MTKDTSSAAAISSAKKATPHSETGSCQTVLPTRLAKFGRAPGFASKPTASTALATAKPWVEDGIGQVNCEVCQDDGRCGDED